MTDVGGQLWEIARRALERCEAGTLVKSALEREQVSLRRFGSVLAFGKAAASMTRAILGPETFLPTMAVIPEGYPSRLPQGARIVWGSHPQITPTSFRAGEEVLAMVGEAEKPVLVLVSGGSSASVEVPLEPFFSQELVSEVNSALLRSGYAIESMNSVRSHLSAIKGGRLGMLLPRDSISIILSDVGRDHWHAVGSGLTAWDPTSGADAADVISSLENGRFEQVVQSLRSGAVPETFKEPVTDCILAGDNRDLVVAAGLAGREAGFHSVNIEKELDLDVSEAVDVLFAASGDLEPQMILVAGGEPRVQVGGSGTGGRCSEMAVRWALRVFHEQRDDLSALMVSSDGVDGTAPAAGYLVPPGAIARGTITPAQIESRLENADSWPVAKVLCEVIPSVPTGNNLRDLFMVARAAKGVR